MKKTNLTNNRKYRMELRDMHHNVAMALSKFAAIMVEKPDEYKTSDGGINYYPTDVLYNWRYYAINTNGQIVNELTAEPSEVAGIICEGVWHIGDTPRKMTIKFKDL